MYKTLSCCCLASAVILLLAQNALAQAVPADAFSSASNSGSYGAPGYWEMYRSPELERVGDIFAGFGPEVEKDVVVSSFSDDVNDPFYVGVCGYDGYSPAKDSSAWAIASNIGVRTFSPDLRQHLDGLLRGTIGPNGPDTVIWANDQFSSGGTPPSGWKFDPGAPRWALCRLPLKIFISDPVRDARDGLVLAEIKAALRTWAEASGGTINYQFTQKFTESDIYFIEQYTTNSELAETLAECHLGPIDRVKVRFMSQTLKSLPPGRLRGLCLHQVGHAFGILKHSNNAKDVMSLAVTDDAHPVTALTKTDRGMMAQLYARWQAPIGVPIADRRVIGTRHGTIWQIRTASRFPIQLQSGANPPPTRAINN